MADEKRDAPRPFDVKTVEYLLRLMSDHDLAEIDLKEGEQRIRLRKGAAIPPGFYPAPHTVAAPPAHTSGSPVVTPGVNAPGSPVANKPAAAPARNLLEIKSPTVGTFYSKPKPDKPPYVAVGAKVTPKTVVCQIEAMKIYNEIAAECAGTIAEVCVKDGDNVEYNTVLFRVEPT